MAQPAREALLRGSHRVDETHRNAAEPPERHGALMTTAAGAGGLKK